MSLELRYLAGKTGVIRSAQYHGRDHIVVPVVMLMEGVIHAINAPTAEFVPLATLSRAPQGWDGRPVVLGHPVLNGRQISANDPSVLEAKKFGRVFKTRIEGKKLLCEAWLDPQKIEKMGEQRMLQRIKSGESIEVSVGAFVSTRAAAGNHLGKGYQSEWAEIMPDHLAFLPNSVGACSIDMGCGAVRTAEAGDRRMSESRTLGERLRALFTFKASAASHRELHERLAEALKKVVPGFMYVEGVYMDNTVVYVVNERPGFSYTEPSVAMDDKMEMYKRSYTSDVDGNVTLSDDAVEVEAVTTFEPKDEDMRDAAGARNSASDMARIQEMHDKSVELGAMCAPKAAEAALTAASAANTEAAENGGKEEPMALDPKKAAIIKALTECPCSGFTTADLTALESFSEERLLAFQAAGAARKAEQDTASIKAAAAAAPAVVPATTEVKPKTVEEFLAEAPEEIRTLIADKQAQDAATRATLVNVLKTAQKEYTEPELVAMDLKSLERLARLTNSVEPAHVPSAPDFSGRATPRVLETNRAIYAPPDGYAQAMKK